MPTSPRKIENMKRKIIPILQKAADYWNKDLLEESEREMRIAARKLAKKKIDSPEISLYFAKLYNNLGAKYATAKNFKKSFTFLSKALTLKIKYEPKNIRGIEGTFKNMFSIALLSCEFDYLSKIANFLLKQYSSEDDFKKYLENCLLITEKVRKNEPILSIAGMEIAKSQSIQRIDDVVYFPIAFDHVEINIKTDLTIEDHSTLAVSLTLSPNNPREKIPTPYETDSWKKLRPPHLEPQIENSTPNLIIFLTEAEHIPESSIKIKEIKGNLTDFEFKIVSTEFEIPDSYPRFGFCFGDPPQIPEGRSFKYFRGKAGIIEWAMKSGEEYQINFEIKNYGEIISTGGRLSTRIGILTPFRKIRFDRTQLKHTDKVKIERLQQKRIKYFEDRDNPCTILLKAETESISKEKFSESYTPIFDSVRRVFNLVNESEKILDDYSILGVAIDYSILPERLSISTVEWEQPIPTALAHLLMDSRFGFPPLCQYDIINNSSKDVIVSVTTEIESFTSKQEDSIRVLPYSRKTVNHTPFFNSDAMKLEETCLSNLKTCALVDGKIVVQKTMKAKLLAADTMIWEILNPLTRETFRMHDFITNWVTPHDRTVEEIVSVAKEEHPKRALVGYAGNTLAEIRESTYAQCEAIFQALKSIGISYVDSSISFGWRKQHLSQRVKFPSTTISTKSANCIDGTVLFASLLEHIGIQPVIVLVPEHAFVGWRLYRNSGELAFLETTQISSADFGTAVKYGYESLNRGLEKAKKIHNNANMTMDNAIKSGYIRLIDVSYMREKEVFPQRT